MESQPGISELMATLSDYRTQLEQVEEMLGYDASNEEYIALKQSLLELIQLTEVLVRDAASEELSASAQQQQLPQRVTGHQPITLAPAPEVPQLPSVLPPQVAQQIRAAQQKAALQGQAPPGWAIGAACEAVWRDDGQYYPATVQGVSIAMNFVVKFNEFENVEEMEPSFVRPVPEGQVGYHGVDAPKRKRVEEHAEEVLEIPKWAEIKPTDDEKTREKKQKVLKSIKSKKRFQQKDIEVKGRQQSWLDFRAGKGTKKKPGFLTGTKKTSMFSVSDDPNAKVGVVGSGKAMTDYKKVGRHDFSNLDK